MAWTADKVADVELFEEPQIIARKAKKLANLIKKSKHFIVFTGAGVSTSAGIPDFRGPDGAWTLMAQGRQRTTKATTTLQAVPTAAHMALVELQNRGLLMHVVSQNCDGLHRKSGIRPENISELHGNSNLEYCASCGKEYLRDFRAVSKYEKSIHDHQTGRRCALCNGKLFDTIINFSESLPAKHVANAFAHARQADLCLVLGSSLRVTPACEIPEVTGLKGSSATLAICNLQDTPLDSLARVRVHAKADDLMICVMQELNLPIPPFVLHRGLNVSMVMKGGNHEVVVEGVDSDGTPASFLKSVQIKGTRRIVRAEPFVLLYREELLSNTLLVLVLEFMGHYAEPELLLEYVYDGNQERKRHYDLFYDPQTGQWRTEVQMEDLVDLT